MPFNLQPTLQGSLICLRPLEKEDFDALYASASDPKIWEQHSERDRYQKAVFQKFFDSAIHSKGAFVVIDLKKGNVIGSSRFYDLNEEKRQITIGYTFLQREYWGGPFNRELKTLMLKHAFQWVDAVNFEISPNNHRSRRAIEKIGAKFIKEEILEVGPRAIYRLEKRAFEAGHLFLNT